MTSRPSSFATADTLRTRCSDFWGNWPDLADRYGCYIFAIRAGRGYRPVYVGKAGKQTFAKECFTTDKTGRHYNPALLDVGRGTPVMFLVTERARRGKPATRRIDDLETFLIQVAAARNPDLSNVKKRAESDWGIVGVIRSPSGKPSASARTLKSMLRL